ncbi:MAG: TetR/AcrR family transcriptional regulator [Pseudophaeobacter sp. bin_em_oilr2.035]|uniref:TetR/AcrR family transcriptional regulator n=2 Tax=Phaeobacter gallaeciensis TaxID=60890 RepID=A0ABD4X7R2_9RHOB|nr:MULTISPECIES: TetR/AcrR family transcriptional regulator [Phaeobacter]MDF1772420.1 TetR/AcrR family transcriptional regulator [Pseudophaeobacter sp. bin_em_oilr2.035]MDE4059958.1 TetR/AcrR family transcriptional regulator [Phaeobacter gallaeciensis]MDE4122980.1 TetR/AcrR family transcriptional regulator [Phaeobacter gallaeciensis]MDE4127446.1 TetR/AcrR family transcriptional regulator [Phaeobacter gallaeciensis]MDE4144323.1 TetR/AcrR family transcriptional regulator [Phaeobacter gallaeciens
MSNKRVQTRNLLLETVLSLLLAPGGSPLRMVDVAKAAGVTRQTVYAHFSNRSEMLISAILHFGDQLDIEARLAPSRTAPDGRSRLEAYTRAMLEFFPEIYPLKQSLMRMGASDEEAKSAWQDRIRAMKEGCAEAVKALKSDGDLLEHLSEAEATDLYFTLLSMDGWAHCVLENGWSDADYLAEMQRVITLALVKQ